MNYNALMHRIGQQQRGPNTSTGLSRRRFFKLTGVTGLAIGAMPALAAAPAQPTATDAPAELKANQQPDAFLRIAPDGTVTIQTNRLEFGQGSHTGLAMILADELDADWQKVRAELAPAGEAFKDPVYGMQMTGGSTGVAHGYMPYRELGARARAMLVAAAASAWAVDPAEVTVANGMLSGPSGQKATFGELSEAAMALPVPATVKLKSIDEFSIIGQPTMRLDTPDKSTGQQDFGLDAKLPNMKTVLIARPPTFGGKVVSFDDTEARKVGGVADIFQVDLDRGATGVAVVANGYWPASMARNALRIEWQAVGEQPDSAAIKAQFTQLLDEPGSIARRADLSSMAGATKRIKADFEFPFLAHAPMEPLNALIEVSGEGADAQCTVWTGTQFQTIDQATVASVLGLQPAQVQIKTQFAGGGFGRRATPTADYLNDTAQVMKAWLAAGHTDPLKIVWSREDDVRGGYYRPYTRHRAEIGLNERNEIVAWDHRIVSPSILTGTPFEAFLVKDGVDATTTEGIGDTAYDVPLALSVQHPTVSVPTLWWRAVGHTHTAFVMESLIDEVARETEQDPIAIRRKLLAKHPRHLAAIDLAVEKSGYGTKQLPTGQEWGVAVHESFGSVVAYIAEVSVANQKPVIHHVTSAIHCNLAINPRSVEAQIEGAALMAVGTTLPGAEITLDKGVVQQSNFHNYPLPRFTDMPSVSVHIVPSAEPPSGVGEPGLPPMAPAIANALARITGKPQRSLPFDLS